MYKPRLFYRKSAAAYTVFGVNEEKKAHHKVFVFAYAISLCKQLSHEQTFLNKQILLVHSTANCGYFSHNFVTCQVLISFLCK